MVLVLKGQLIRIQLQSTSPCASIIITLHPTLPSPCTASLSRRSGTYCSHTAHHNRSTEMLDSSNHLLLCMVIPNLQVARTCSSRFATRSPIHPLRRGQCLTMIALLLNGYHTGSCNSPALYGWSNSVYPPATTLLKCQVTVDSSKKTIRQRSPSPGTFMLHILAPVPHLFSWMRCADVVPSPLCQ